MYCFPKYGFALSDLAQLVLKDPVLLTQPYAEACDLWEKYIDVTKPEDAPFRQLVQTFLSETSSLLDQEHRIWDLKNNVKNVRDLIFAALSIWSDFRHACGDAGFFAFARNVVRVVVKDSQHLEFYLNGLFPRTTLCLLPSTRYIVDAIHASPYLQLRLEGAEDRSSIILLNGSLVFSRNTEIKNLTIQNAKDNTFICSFDGRSMPEGFSVLNVAFQNVTLYAEYGGTVVLDRVSFENSHQALVANNLNLLVLRDCKMFGCKSGIMGNHLEKVEFRRLHVDGILERNLFNITTKDVLFDGLVVENVANMGIIKLPPMIMPRNGSNSKLRVFPKTEDGQVLSLHFIAHVIILCNMLRSCQASGEDSDVEDLDNFYVFVSDTTGMAVSTQENEKDNQQVDEKNLHDAMFESDGHATTPVTPEPAEVAPPAPGKALARTAVQMLLYEEEPAEQDGHKKIKTSST